jgi:hypothetical protein
MANDRKVQFATQVIPKIEVQQAAYTPSVPAKSHSAVPGSLEEYDITKPGYTRSVSYNTRSAYQYNKTHTSVNKTLGGNGYIDINATQWGDGWTSFISPQATWDANISNWEATGTDTWDGIITISSTLIQLSSDSSTMAFCYIKNTGSNAVKVTLEYGAGSPKYPFILPVAGSVQFKGYSTSLAINKIGVVRVSSDSTIEYVIAKA